METTIPKMDEFRRKMRAELSKSRLIEPGDTVVVAVSGGADSVCLLQVLCSLREEMELCLVAAHVNHGLRGTQADEDADFVRGMCEVLSVPFYEQKVDVSALSKDWGVGLEEAGRRVRYAFFEKVRKETDAGKVATAHTADDQAETVLMRIVRGTSVDGLCGILPRRDDGVVRPLLWAWKREILQYLEDGGIGYRTDASNFDEAYTRNYIRKTVLNDLERINPNVREALLRLSSCAAQDTALVNKQVTAAMELYRTVDGEAVLVDCRLFAECAPAVAGRVLLAATKEAGATEVEHWVVERLTELVQSGENGKKVALPNDVVGALEYGKLAIYRKLPNRPFCYPLEVGHRLEIIEAGVWICCESVDAAQKQTAAARGDAVELSIPAEAKVVVRSRRPGDAYVPAGFSGHRKIKELLIDEKVPGRLRDRIPVLEVDGEIAWVYGFRAGENFRAGSRSDGRTVVLRYGRLGG